MQVVREAEDADVSDDDVNYPARVYAAAELLERHCLGLRELLCQVRALRKLVVGWQSDITTEVNNSAVSQYDDSKEMFRRTEYAPHRA